MGNISKHLFKVLALVKGMLQRTTVYKPVWGRYMVNSL